MRLWLLAPVLVLGLTPPVSLAQSTGGASAPAGHGGAEYGTSGAKTAKKKSKKRKARVAVLRATHFSVDPGTLTPGAEPATFTYRLDGIGRRARVRIDIVRAPGEAGPRVRLRLRMGYKRLGSRQTYRWKMPEDALAPGNYLARLHAVDNRGRKLVRTASASGSSNVAVIAKPVPVTVGNGVFPVQGAYTWGSDGARFGADRGDHVHQGQDLSAAEGTPLVSPRAGTVYFKAYQSNGAGHYLVIRGDDGRDYVFMHLKSGSPTVGRDDPVSAGQVIAQVGNTGRSFGAHLHFEIWPDGWYAKGSQPVDPRPQLEAWAAQAAS